MAVSITATPNVSPSGVPRVRLVVAGATSTSVNVYRQDPDGRTLPVRQGSPVVVASGGATIYDYEAAFDLPATYTVQDGSTIAASAAVTATSGGVAWLVHPGMPEMSVPLGVLEWPKWKLPVDRGVFAPIGRKNRVVVSARRQSGEGDLGVYTASAAAGEALDNILADGTALLLKGTETEGAGTRWVSVGDVDRQPIEVDLRTFIVWTLPLIEVDSPAGNALPPVTYADANATFFNYQQATARARTYVDRIGGQWKA